MNILAIDPATLTGWAISPTIYGTISFKTQKGESLGVKWLKFERWLKETIIKYNIHFVAYERPGGRNKGAMIHHSKLNGVIEKVCEALSESLGETINYKEFSAKEIKKFATNKGNCGKPLMIEAAQLLYDYPGNNDNEADALHILHLAKSLI